MAWASRLRLVIPDAQPSTQSLAEPAALGRVRVGHSHPGQAFGFEDAAEAIRYLEVEHARAKVVIAFF
jgi:hypothetical protein